MATRCKDGSALPLGWVVYENDSGAEYYFNEHTQVTTWDRPVPTEEGSGAPGTGQRRTHKHSMPELPEVEGLSGERRKVWEGLRDQVYACRSKSGPEGAAHEAGLEAQMRTVRESDPHLWLAVDENGDSLMHHTARCASTAGLVRCVWECCGERALQIMRHTTRWGYNVLLRLAGNPDVALGMYAVFAEHCTDDDLRAATTDGWTVLFWMALTFIHDAKTEEQEENVASMMCAVVQRLGPGALLAEATNDSSRIPVGSSPRSVLHDAGDKGRALLQRLEEAAAHPEATEAEETAGQDAASRARVTPRSAATSAPAAASAEAKQSPAAATTRTATGGETKGSADTPVDHAAAAAVPAREHKKVSADEEEDDDSDDVWDVNPSDVDGPPQEEFNKIILLRVENKMEAMTKRMRAALEHMQGVKDMAAGDDDTVQSQRLPPLVEIARGEITPVDLESEAEALGEGGAGDVYLGQHDARPVAIKKMRLSAAQLRQGDSNTDVYRTKREARILQLAGHPNIIRCMGACLEGGEALLVLEHAELGSVHDILQRPGAQRPLRVDPECKRQWITDVVSALLYIHHMDIIHRDVKPANFLVMRNGRVKLADFGLARLEGNRTHQTAQAGETAVGTWVYLAHELLRVARGQLPPYSKASDVYALAISIMEIVMEACWLPPSLTFTDIQSRVCDFLEHPQVPPVSEIPETLRSAVAVAEKGWRPVVQARPTMDMALRQLESSIVPTSQGSNEDAEKVEEIFNWVVEHAPDIRRPNARRYAEAFVAADLTSVRRLQRRVQRNNTDFLNEFVSNEEDHEDLLQALRESS